MDDPTETPDATDGPDDAPDVTATPEAGKDDEYDCTCPKCGANFTVQIAPDKEGDDSPDVGPSDAPDMGLDDAGGFSFARGR